MKADLALALTSLHHPDTLGVDQRLPPGGGGGGVADCTKKRPLRPQETETTAELGSSRTTAYSQSGKNT